MKSFEILSLNISRQKGVQKEPVEEVELQVDHGILGDAHAGNWHRQISLLAQEDIDTLQGLQIHFGDFAENITTRGIDLASLPLGSRLVLGECEVEVTQIGKECHQHCAIYDAAGDCVMPRKGIFAKVVRGGLVNRDSRCYHC